MRSTSRAIPRLLAAVLLPLLTAGCRLSEPEEQPQPTPEPPAPTAPSGGHDAAPAAGDTPPAVARESDVREDQQSPVRVVYPGQSLGHLVADLRGAVVNIRTTAKVKGGPASMYPGAEDDVSLGSGFVLDDAGHVLTNDHILAQARALRVVLAAGAGRVDVPARIVGRAPELDIALLAVDTDLPLEPAPLGDSSALHVGEWVVALGNPFGREITASAGIVSSIEGAESIPSLDSSPMRYRSLLVTDAAIHPGNSGGPLVDTSGRVVGVSTATDPRGVGLGFAMPIDRVQAILPMLKQEGRFRRSWLGVFIHPVEPPVAEDGAAQAGASSPRGALVSEVVPGSPAAKAGIQAGDIVMRFDGHDVDHRNLPWLAATTGKGRRIPLVVWRDGSEQALALVSELMPE